MYSILSERSGNPLSTLNIVLNHLKTLGHIYPFLSAHYLQVCIECVSWGFIKIGTGLLLQEVSLIIKKKTFIISIQ